MSSRAGPLAVAAAVLALVAACSGGSHPAVSHASSSPDLAAMDSYARCLRAHGLPKAHVTRAPSAPNHRNTVLIFDGLSVQGATPGSPQIRTAVHACRHRIPQGKP